MAHQAQEMVTTLETMADKELLNIVLGLLESNNEIEINLALSILGNNNELTKYLTHSLLVNADIFSEENEKPIAEFEHPETLIPALYSLYKRNILTSKTLNLIYNFPEDVAEPRNYPKNIAEALCYLHQNNFLSEDIIELIDMDEVPRFSAQVLCELHQESILTQDNLDLILGHSAPLELLTGLANLLSNQILTPDNFPLITEHQTPQELAEALTYLLANNMLSPEAIHILAAHENPENLALAFFELRHNHLFTAENLALISALETPYDVAKAISILSQNEILNERNIHLIQTHDEPISLAIILSELKNMPWLTQDHRASIASKENLHILEKTLTKLREEGKLQLILTPENLSLIIDHRNPYSLAETFFHLHINEARALGYQLLAAKLPEPHKFITVIVQLHRFRLLTPENLTLLNAHLSPQRILISTVILHKNQLLTSDNLSVLISQVNNHLDYAIFCLHKTGILNQANFNALILPTHAILLTTHIIPIIWNGLPPALLRQHWQAILHAASQAQPILALRALRVQILAAPTLENQQITHTASIHQSISQSARNLATRYHPNLANIEMIILEIKAFVRNLDSSFKNDTAKRAILRLTHLEFAFTDPSSEVSIRQLLALIFIGIHDEQNRQGTRQDAFTLFIEGLYEIQRGYNLNERNEDNGQADQPICSPGTFNKLVEKLAGIHPDIEIRVITKAQAAMKLPRVVSEESLNYLRTLASPMTIEAYLAFSQLIRQIHEEGIEPIWPHIQAPVRHRLFDEFGTLYTAADFTTFIEAGIYSPIENLEQFDEIVQQSVGFHAWQSTQSANSLWRQANTDNPEPDAKKPRI